MSGARGTRAEKQPSRQRRPARERWFWVSVPIGLAVGLASGLGLWNWQLDREQDDLAERARLLQTGPSEVDAPPPPGEELRALIAQDGPVVIDEAVADQISDEQLARAREILTVSGKPLHLAFMRKPDYMYDGYTTEGALATWAHDVGEDGHYVVLWTGGRADVHSVGFDEEYLWEEAEGQPGPALVRVAEVMAEFSLDDEEDDEPTVTRDDRDYWGGAGGGVGIAFLLVFFVLLPAYAGLFALARRRAPRDLPPGAGADR